MAKAAHKEITKVQFHTAITIKGQSKQSITPEQMGVEIKDVGDAVEVTWEDNYKKIPYNMIHSIDGKIIKES